MWVDTRDCVPLMDGCYLVQTVYGEIEGYKYTANGGWNTYYDRDGKLHTDHAIERTYVARWLYTEAPDEVPTEWVDEFQEAYRRSIRKGGSK